MNGVLSGSKWATGSLTYSFTVSAGQYGRNYAGGENLKNFEALESQQTQAIADILKMYARISNASFDQVGSAKGELRFAESDSRSTAWAYGPDSRALGGDVWFNNSLNLYDAPARGNYAWLTMMHEIGHSLGLKHPHESLGSFSAMPLERDSLEYTVMSYRSYIGGTTKTGYTNTNDSYPQTLMMYDIAAIQKLYGADYSANGGDTVYSWSETTGTMFVNGVAQAAPNANRVFMTVWDGGGNDTYSFANYATGVKVDLAPGAWTTASAQQLAYLGDGHYAAGNIANALLYNGKTASLIENAVGGTGNDTISGNSANNKLTGGVGDDVLDGRGGIDTAVYSGLASDYAIVRNADDSWTISDGRAGLDGTDTLRNIEYFKFSDQVVVGASPPANKSAHASAAADAYSTLKGAKLHVKAAAGVLKNDEGGRHLKAVLISDPKKGDLDFKANGAFVYSPTKHQTGTVTFKYAVTDGVTTSEATKVAISVRSLSNKNKGHNGNDAADHDQIPMHGHAVASLGDWSTHDSWDFTSLFEPQGESAWLGTREMLAGINSLLEQMLGEGEQWMPFGIDTHGPHPVEWLL
jgi:serralysin